jgi:hypothetical protein
MLFQRVVHKARAVHRLDHRAHALTMQASNKAAQPVDVRRHRRCPNELAALVKQADVQAPSTQIHSSVQLEAGPPPGRSSMTR